MTQSNYFLLTQLYWVQSYDLIQLIPIWRFKLIDFHSLFRTPFDYLVLMLFPSPSTWKMVKDVPIHIPENMIG